MAQQQQEQQAPIVAELQQQSEAEIAEEEDYFQEIDKLQEMGINVADIKKLKSAGLGTVASVLMTPSSTLLAIKGVSDVKIAKIIEAANKLENFGFRTGTDVMSRRKQILRITTGSTAVDELLHGGIESQAITEVFGEFRTGKTQLSHTLAVTAQLPSEHGGGNGKVLFIDTEGTFRPERIISIAERFGVDSQAVLDNIAVARAFTHEMQINLLIGAAAKLIEDHYSLIIVDSCTALFRSDFLGRGQLAERQQKLGHFLSQLHKLSEEFNVAVIITNQVVSDPGGGAMFVSDMKKPIGGNIMAHSSTTRLSLRKGRGEQRICKVYDSPCLPESEAIYQLTQGGIDNPES